MRQVVNASKAFGLGSLNVGYVGENNVTEIAFDFTEWYEEYGAGAPVLRLKRFGDKEAYPVVLDLEAGHIAVWTITSTDLQNKGVGKGQLQYMVDEVVKKSMVFDFMVENSLESTEEVPDPYEDWMDDLVRLTGESETNAYNASESASDALGYKNDAKGYSDTASEYAANASLYAGQAEGYKNDALGYKNDASAFATQAQGYANDALGYKNDASGYASSASGYASDASGYADSAQGYANDASGYADSASGYANDAQGYASDASDSADSASASAEEAREYAEQTERSIPSHVRLAIYTLLENAAYATTGLTDEIEVVQSWAEEVQSLVLSDTELELEEDTPQVITAVTIPYGATVSWTTSNPEVATVDNGIVTGASNGSCIITASAGDLSATCDVTVAGFVELVSISAVYTQSGTVYDTDSVDSLKADLVVTATYSDSSTETIPSTDYTLSGTLEVGTSTIYVVYGGKTDTFSVTVTLNPYKLVNGTAKNTSNDEFVVANNNEVSVTTASAVSADGFFINLSDITLNGGLSRTNGSTVVNNQPKRFTIPSGASVKLKVSGDFSGFAPYTSVDGIGINMRKALDTTSVSGTGITINSNNKTQTTFEATATINQDTDVGCLFIFLPHSSKGYRVEFTVELWINGEKVI